MAKDINAENMIEIDEDMFNDLFKIKQYCESQRNCHNCNTRENCKEFTKTTAGCDFSCMEIGRINDNDNYRYFIICT